LPLGDIALLLARGEPIPFNDDDNDADGRLEAEEDELDTKEVEP